MRFIDPIKQSNPSVSYADLYTVAGATAVEAMGGPYIPWRAGRTDDTDGGKSPNHGRMPDAKKDAAEVQRVFDRLGFNQEQTVALIGAHVLGQCHPEFSNFSGPWTGQNRRFSNDYFR
jgi:catalase (peroxidase I)